MDKLLEMSTKEISRLEVMHRLSKKQMSQKEAGQILRVSTRQIKRLLQAYRTQGKNPSPYQASPSLFTPSTKFRC